MVLALCYTLFKDLLNCAKFHQQVAQWATIAYLGASIMFGDNIILDAQWQVTLN